MSGKTTLVWRIIENAAAIIEPPVQKFVYCYGEYQDVFAEFAHKVEFIKGLPSQDMFTGHQPLLLIIDDLMVESNSNNETALMFTRTAHHKNLSVLYLTQNIFFGSKHNRTIQLNTHYLFLFKNPRDTAQIFYLARQIFPTNSKFLVESYIDSTKEPYSYLLIDLKPTTPEELRVRSGLFKEDTIFVYRPK